VYIPMRDGVKLFTAVYTPNNNDEKHPFLITRTPYSCAPYGEDKYTSLWSTYKLKYAKEGYVFVFQDVRGRYMSEGVFEDVRPFNKNKKGIQVDSSDFPATSASLWNKAPSSHGFSWDPPRETDPKTS
jgi:predicted acyl esterase